MNWWVFRTEILGVGHIHAAAAWTSAIEDSGPRIGSQSGRGKATQIGAVHGGADVRFYCPLLVRVFVASSDRLACSGLLGLALAAAVSPTAGEP